MTFDMFCHKQYMRCRDHRKLGQELDLFSIESESAGGGLVFWHPNGAAIRNILENFWKVSLGCMDIPFVPLPHQPSASPPRCCGLVQHYEALHPLCHHSAVKLSDSNLGASFSDTLDTMQESNRLLVTLLHSSCSRHVCQIQSFVRLL